MRKTKIVCTLGPACLKEDILQEMLQNGMNVARFNFSHGTHEYHKNAIAMLRRVRDRLNLPVSVLLDTKGPEIRLRDFEGGKITLKTGDTFTLTTTNCMGDASRAAITYPDLPRQLHEGVRILLDDGKVALTVLEANETDIRCRVDVGGPLSNHKSINIPNFHIDMPYISEQDKKDLLFGIEQDVDFVAASFVRCREDVIQLRKFLDYHGGHSIKIISKIENINHIYEYYEM